MSRLYKIFRALIMIVVVLSIFIPTALYVVLSTDWAQEQIRQIAERELTGVLGTDVSIGGVRLTPFSRLELKDVSVDDDYGKTALDVQSVDTRFEFWNFITTFRLSFDYAELKGAKIALYKQTPDSPLNIANILKNLKPKEKSDSPTKFDLSVFTVRINDAAFTYDVLSVPVKEEGFDKDHIALDRLCVIATAPEISDSRIEVLLRQMSFIEKQGFELADLSTRVVFTPSSLDVSDLVLELPESKLMLGSYKFGYDTPAGLGNIFKTIPVHVTLQEGSYFTPSDFRWFLPGLSDLRTRFDISLDGDFSSTEVDVKAFSLVDDKQNIDLSLNGSVRNYKSLDSIEYTLNELNFKASASKLLEMYGSIGKPLNHTMVKTVSSLGNLSVVLNSEGNSEQARAGLDVKCRVGDITFDAKTRFRRNWTGFDTNAKINLKNINIASLFPKVDIDGLSADLVCNLTLEKGHKPYGAIELVDGSAIYRSELFDGVTLTASLDRSGDFNSILDLSTSHGILHAGFNGTIDENAPRLAGNVKLEGFNPYEWELTRGYPDYQLGVDIAFDLSGKLGEWIDGYVDISDLNFVNTENEGLKIKHIELQANNSVSPNIISLESDFINGRIQGEISPWTIVPEAKYIISRLVPALFPDRENNIASLSEDSLQPHNDFNFNFQIDNAENLANFFKVPVAVVYPVSIDGEFDYETNSLVASVDAPYLMKGDMIIENSLVQIKVEEENPAEIYLTTQFPTKKGDMVIATGITADNDRLSTEIDWNIEREKPVGGKIGFDVALQRTQPDGQLETKVEIKPSDIRFGEDTWKFSPSSVVYRPGFLSVEKFCLQSNNQAIKIDGISDAENPDSEIRVALDNIFLLSIFETLDINKALIGGVATGVFHAKGIFGPELSLECPSLHVDSIGYNRCTLGNADLRANWDNEAKSFHLDADIIGERNTHSHIYGDIFPGTESLDMYFEADRAKVGFMKPFIDAFASDITGYASGNAHLFGTFKYIDLEGDIYAEDLGVKIDFTNTWYFANDSIKLRPGLIDISDVEVKDIYGNTARLNGRVEHTFFKDPVFDFKVTDAHNFLSYDVTKKLNPDWYGRIFGNGSAFINGRPGVVNIDVDMTTAPDSKFTFVLSDNLIAEEYGFITFRDKNRNVITDSIIQVDDLPEAVRAYRDRKLAEALAQNPPSAYNMNIQVDITPDAQVVLVMDPVGGDEINCNGHGNLRMTYASVGNELRMFGNYTIERGTYNFTLQDVIVKDFSIKEGSSISFSGDPYNARLDIQASYAVNANLSDLDESFLQDKELNRTNVPVHALLVVTGDMRQPDISFDLEFPTLTSDVYRKVRSIISTDEMMNRQIIYLLALNRFYTPEYMSATKGNELFSVASSTISSRLSSMLGKLSDHWTIAPNLRSDRGDFSDVEFDLALSSSLLNNRLRLNGNFGYRDKSLNTNQFIGDFDLEYLLNRSGSWRLKAYNRYNDQNYYLRTAQTTQGVGIMFKKDFDSIFGFLRRKKKNETPVTDSEKNDTPSETPEEKSTQQPADSTAVSKGPSLQPVRNEN